MHHLVIGTNWGGETDHINRNKLDNRRGNLRRATHSQNMCNRVVKSRLPKSGYRGVVWRVARGKWSACINVKRKEHFLGYFADKEDAARAYDDAARRLHGEFARLNFPANNEHPARVL
jgi:hypothetical protein